MVIDLAACRARQQRLVQAMQQQQLDWVIVAQAEHVQYFSGHRFHWTFSPYLAVHDDGHVVLVGPENRTPADVAADDVRTYQARWHSTLRNDQRQTAAQVLLDAMGAHRSARRIGVEFSQYCLHLPWRAELVDVEPDLYRLRRCKDADELALLRRAIQATERMYERARGMIEPGINELDVFSELQTVAVRELGEPLTATGNDYQANARGGAPRDRQAQAGELYILYLGPAYRGYFADNARTIAVTDPDPRQLAAWREVVAVFQFIEQSIRPGVSARATFQHAEQLLARSALGVFNHHLGHGIGLFPHEAPHLNPYWDDTFQAGDVFAAEPGLYAAELRAGLRIENNYLVTETGVERLTNFPMELKL
jgi:Xaa-Pro aminopeptidase